MWELVPWSMKIMKLGIPWICVLWLVFFFLFYPWCPEGWSIHEKKFLYVNYLISKRRRAPKVLLIVSLPCAHTSLLKPIKTHQFWILLLKTWLNWLTSWIYIRKVTQIIIITYQPMPHTCCIIVYILFPYEIMLENASNYRPLVWLPYWSC